MSILAPSLLFLGVDPALAEVLVVPSTTKVMKDRPLPSGTVDAAVEAARGEWEGFQVVVSAGAKPILAVDLVPSDLAGPGGATIPSTSFEFSLEYQVHITAPSSCGEALSTICADHPEYGRLPGFYPDALVPFSDPYSDAHGKVAAPFDVPANGVAVVFADVFVPAKTPPGIYKGVVEMQSKGGAPTKIPVTVRVWDFDMPAKRNIATAFGFGMNQTAWYHGGPGGGDEATRLRIRRNYEMAVHRHRIDFTTYNPGLDFKVGPDGKVEPIDFTAYDAYLGPRIDGSFFPDGAGINRFNVGMFEPGQGTMGLTEGQFSQAAAMLAGHLEQRGWLDSAYLYSADEPWLPTHTGAFDRIKQGVKLIGKETGLWKGHVLVTGPWDARLDGYVDIWCPVTAMYADNYWPSGTWPGKDKYAELLAKGQELWFYVCNADFPPLPGYDIDTPTGFEPRLTKWGAWYEGATGFLYWSISYWQNPDPWNVVANVAEFGEMFARNGDGILIYPGNHDGTRAGAGSPPGIAIDGPVISYRLKQVRDGLEDWELFIMAGKLGAGAYARAQVGRAYTTFGTAFDTKFTDDERPWTLDEQVLLDARRNVALKVQYLLHPDLYDDPEAPPEPEVADLTPDPVPEPEPVPEIDLVLPKGKSGCAAGGGGTWGVVLLLVSCLVVYTFHVRSSRQPA